MTVTYLRPDIEQEIRVREPRRWPVRVAGWTVIAALLAVAGFSFAAWRLDMSEPLLVAARAAFVLLLFAGPMWTVLRIHLAVVRRRIRQERKLAHRHGNTSRHRRVS